MLKQQMSKRVFFCANPALFPKESQNFAKNRKNLLRFTKKRDIMNWIC